MQGIAGWAGGLFRKFKFELGLYIISHLIGLLLCANKETAIKKHRNKRVTVSTCFRHQLGNPLSPRTLSTPPFLLYPSRLNQIMPTNNLTTIIQTNYAMSKHLSSDNIPNLCPFKKMNLLIWASSIRSSFRVIKMVMVSLAKWIVRREKASWLLLVRKSRKKKKGLGKKIRKMRRKRRKKKRRKMLVWLLIRGRVGRGRGREDGEANLEVL